MTAETIAMAILGQVFPGWWTWCSGTGRWWASWRGTLTLEQIRAGCRVAVDADDAGTLACRIDEQEALAGRCLAVGGDVSGGADDRTRSGWWRESALAPVAVPAGLIQPAIDREDPMIETRLLDVAEAAEELRKWDGADMAELVEFLAVRLDEDERAAPEAVDPGRARRVVEAHRQILDAYLRSAIACADNPQLSSFRNAWRDATIEVVSIYADHPDYRDEFYE